MARILEQLGTRWRSSSKFMAHRHGWLGIPRRALGVVMESATWLAAKVVPTVIDLQPEPKNIFILRNNDLGDLLVTTPMFEALRKRFPSAHITVAVGKWNVATMQNNPNVDETITLNAPWFNHFVPNASLPAALRFVWFDPQVRQLRNRKFDTYIDVVGSHFGAMLGVIAGIPRRIGVRGYAGGHSAMTQTVDFSSRRRVPVANLQFATLLGAVELPPPRPQLFLSPEETATAEQRWVKLSAGRPARRVVIGPGVGSPGRSWPIEWYAQLAHRLTAAGDVQILVVGGPKDADIGEQITRDCSAASNQCGKFSLRDTFAAVSTADLVICNASMLSHVAAAFWKPTVVLLGPSYRSAEQESALWGYDTCDFLGREKPTDAIVSLNQAWQFVQRKLADLPSGSPPRL